MKLIRKTKGGEKRQEDKFAELASIDKVERKHVLYNPLLAN